MLFGQQRGRHQHRDLLAGGGGDEGRAHRDFGLAEADVAADHAVHRLRAGQVADHRFDRGVLVGRFLEREGRRERLVHRAVDVEREARRARRRLAWISSSSAATSRTFSAALRLALSHCSPPSECSGAVSGEAPE